LTTNYNLASNFFLTFTLLYIRLKQLQREINGLGLYLLVFIAIAASLFFICYKQFESGEMLIILLQYFVLFVLAYNFTERISHLFINNCKTPICKYFQNMLPLFCLLQLQASLLKAGYVFQYYLHFYFVSHFLNFLSGEKQYSKICPLLSRQQILNG
jgi:hypothetical protein